VTTSEALVACARLQVKMECGENAMFSLREHLLRAPELFLAAKIDYVSKGKEDIVAKIVMLNCNNIFIQLRLMKLRCEQAIKCTENTFALMEMAQTGIAAESRYAG
jgi:hypothetical protein